jgi:hypothetical protein
LLEKTEIYLKKIRDEKEKLTNEYSNEPIKKIYTIDEINSENDSKSIVFYSLYK